MAGTGGGFVNIQSVNQNQTLTDGNNWKLYVPQGPQGAQGAQGSQLQGSQGSQGGQGPQGTTISVGYQAVQFNSGSTSLVDIPGLQVNGLTSGSYYFVAEIGFNSSSGTNGVQFAVQYNGSSTAFSATISGNTSGVAAFATGRFATKGSAVGCQALGTVATTPLKAVIHGQVVASGNGSLGVQVAKLTSQNVGIYPESFIRVYKVA